MVPINRWYEDTGGLCCERAPLAMFDVPFVLEYEQDISGPSLGFYSISTLNSLSISFLYRWIRRGNEQKASSLGCTLSFV
jgi:hypothetical protein